MLQDLHPCGFNNKHTVKVVKIMDKNMFEPVVSNFPTLWSYSYIKRISFSQILIVVQLSYSFTFLTAVMP